MREISFTELADADVVSRICDYENRQPGLGDRFERYLEQRLDLIRQFPESFAIVEDDVRAATIDVFQDVVYYCVEADRIVIFAVLFGRRDPALWKRRLS